MASSEEDFSSLPLTERLTHKSWKARQGAYDELAKIFNTLDPDADNEYRKWQEYLKKMVSDSNLVAQESGLTAILAYVTNAPSANKTRSVLASMVVDKCLGSNRAGTKAKALDVLMMYIEIDVADPVIEDIISGLNHKTPKNVAAAVFALREAVRLFGARIVNVKPILKQLPKIFDHKDKSVRSEGTALAVELYRWLGSAIINSLSDLKPVQIKELHDQFDKLPQERATPERLIRSEQAKIQAQGPAADGDEGAGESINGVDDAPEPVDAYDLADPVNILDKLPKNFYEQLASTKWKERKEILENLLEIAKAPKLEDGKYGELINALGKRINDANLFVVIASANCIEGIAKGLRNHFAQYRSLVIHPLIEKFKEKKQNVVEALRGALDAIYLSVTINEVVEEINGSASHKNPQVRSETLQWLIRCLKTTRKLPGKSEIKSLSEMLVKSLEDSVDTVREGAAEALGTLMKVVSERVLVGHLDKLDNIKQTKVKEYFEKAEVKLVSGTGTRKAVTSAAPPRRAETLPAKPRKPKMTSNSLDAQEKENHAPSSTTATKARPPTTAKPTSKASVNGTLKRAHTAAPVLAKAPAGKKPASREDEPIVSKYTNESADAVVCDMIGEEVMQQLGDSAWKVRLGAAQSMLEKLQQQPKDAVEAEAVVRSLTNKPGWKESNFQVMTNVLNIFQYLARDVPSFNRAAGAAVVPGLADKLGDMKVKRSAGDCLTTIAEKLSLQFVLSQAYDSMKKQKSPKVLADSLMWIQQTLLEFGTGSLKLREFIEFLKFTLTNTNSAVRNNAVTVLGTLRMFTGSEIRTFVQDLNPQLLATIDSEFEKAAAKAPPPPTKQQQLDETAAAADPTDDLFPRVDISGQITGKLIVDMGNAQWKVRKEALDDLVRILEAANKRIQPNFGSELIPALKARLSDSNKNLAMNAVELTGNLALAVGKPFERHVKLVISPMTSLLADQKAHVRGAALAALDNVFLAVGLDSLIPSFGVSLMTEQPQMRKDLLKWLGDKLEATEKVPDLSPLIHSILICLQDRNADVRKGAQGVLAFVATDVGVDALHAKAGDLFKGSALASVTPYLEALRPVGGRPSSASSSIKSATPGKVRKPLSTVAAGTSDAAGTKSKLPGASKLRMTRSGTGTLSRKEAAESPKEHVAPLLTSDARAKEQRAAADRGMTKWTFDSPRRELIDFLAEQCEGNFSSEVHTRLFSTDHYKEKEYLAALTAIDGPISEGLQSLEREATAIAMDASELKARYIANADLILKYITLRFFDTNTSMFLKCLELLDHLFALLDEDGYHLSEYEASSFLPFFINKTGDPKETMRVKIRGILKRLARIYPSSKLFTYLLKGLESKNARTRTECLEELASLVQRNGMGVCIPSKSFPLIAAQLADRDASVRGGALGVITQAYLLVGDGVWKLLGRVSEKDKSFVEERLKRVSNSRGGKEEDRPSPKGTRSVSPKSGKTSPGASPKFDKKSMPVDKHAHPVDQSTMNKPGSPTQTKKNPVFSLELEKHGLVVPKREYPSAARPSHFSPTRLPSYGPVSPPRSPDRNVFVPEPMSSNTIDLLITNITSNDPYESVDALKQLEDILGTQSEIVAPHMNDLVSALTLQNRLAYTSLVPGRTSLERLCKHLVNVLVICFSQPVLARSVGREQLKLCMTEVLDRILDPVLDQIEQGPALNKALNILVVKILESVDRNSLLGVALALLIESSDVMITLPAENRSRQAKHMNLILRCLWRITKTLSRLLATKSIKPDILLLDIHNFFVRLPPREWKRRAVEYPYPQADMPFRTVKTIVGEIAKCLGPDLRPAFHLIPNQETSYCVKYALHTLDGRSGSEMGDTPKAGSELDLVAMGSPSNVNRSTVNSGAASPVLHRSRSSIPSESLTARLQAEFGYTDGGDDLQELGDKQPISRPLTSAAFKTTSESVTHKDEPVDITVPGTVNAAESVSVQLTEPEVQDHLNKMWERLLDKDVSKFALQELYDFRKTHSYAMEQIEAKIRERGDFFEEYIRRGLRNCTEEEAKKLDLEERRSRRAAGSTAVRDLSPHDYEGYRRALDRIKLTWWGTTDLNEIQRLTPQEGEQALEDSRQILNEKIAPPVSPSGLVASADESAAGTPRSGSPGSPTSNGSGDGGQPVKKAQTVAELKERLAMMKKRTADGSVEY
ncbi:hypothetical protein SpCBS45565_g02541 [Spizellomyces sp. 'palustris']|nr:hypothetical protein SpCBS45565_g02541 [Spizellomyces sp. 'palustris']